MQIELKCKINVKNENANRICRCFRGLRRLHIQICFLRLPSVGSAAVSFAVGSKAHCRSHCKQRIRRSNVSVTVSIRRRECRAAEVNNAERVTHDHECIA